MGGVPWTHPVGHETVAPIEAVGSGVSRHQVGDLVLVPFQLSCGSCSACRGSRYGAGSSFRATAGPALGFGEAGGGHGGAFADLLRVPFADRMLIAAPAGVPIEALATLPDNVVDAYRAVATQWFRLRVVRF